ncbi:hypothetical protein I862_00010 [endosymbiont of Acanthamoeba sp. UWC8]|uniref:hypothetical protein n=1 Tax=endosymbiont of Acanthamoeba sp. UWC8 TaxID=86106 RepID=UPI0004D1F234|nr:hypothetical protein [endosymbiont of Acanthamoeba sp. UWC8]AIF80567.1 hypothetical protein I862_00010 [endosymbiont of Acanthamoeba sp. UWC8]
MKRKEPDKKGKKVSTNAKNSQPNKRLNVEENKDSGIIAGASLLMTQEALLRKKVNESPYFLELTKTLINNEVYSMLFHPLSKDLVNTINVAQDIPEPIPGIKLLYTQELSIFINNLLNGLKLQSSFSKLSIIKISKLLHETNLSGLPDIIQTFKIILSYYPLHVNEIISVFSLFEKVSTDEKFDSFYLIQEIIDYTINAYIEKKDHYSLLALSKCYLELFKNFPQREVIETINKVIIAVSNETNDQNIFSELFRLNEALKVWNNIEYNENKELIFNLLADKIKIYANNYDFINAYELDRAYNNFNILFNDEITISEHIYFINECLVKAIEEWVKSEDLTSLSLNQQVISNNKWLSADIILTLCRFYLKSNFLYEAGVYINKAISEAEDNIFIEGFEATDKENFLIIEEFLEEVAYNEDVESVMGLYNEIDSKELKSRFLKLIKDACHKKITNCIEGNDYKEANRLFTIISDKLELNEAVLLLLMQLNINGNQYIEANKYLTLILERDFYNKNILESVRVILDDTLRSYQLECDYENFNEMIELIRKAWSDKKLNYNPINILIETCEKLINPSKEARYSIEKLIHEIMPDNIGNVKKLYYSCYYLEKYEEALGYALKVVAQEPEDEVFQLNLIDLYYDTKQYNYIIDNQVSLLEKFKDYDKFKRARLINFICISYNKLYFDSNVTQITPEQKAGYLKKMIGYINQGIGLYPYLDYLWSNGANYFLRFNQLNISGYEAEKERYRSLIEPYNSIGQEYKKIKQAVCNGLDAPQCRKELDEIFSELPFIKNHFARQKVADYFYYVFPNGARIFQEYLQSFVKDNKNAESLKQARGICLKELMKPYTEGDKYDANAHVHIYNIAKTEFCMLTRREIITGEPRALRLLATIKVLENCNSAALPDTDNEIIKTNLIDLTKDQREVKTSIFITPRAIYSLKTNWGDKVKDRQSESNNSKVSRG